ncbi:MAG TPA: hypothetical protein ENK83_05405 [Aliiroseovarius sp.]|nr:hypothetical protein [Aliiroseovarius sp.]
MLTGDSVTIDGVPLQVVATDLRILEADGTTYYQTRGQQYVSPEMRLWFLGTDSVVGDDGSVTNYDATQAAFLFPGDPGFDDETPLYGCAAGAEDGVKTAPLPAGPGKNTNK